MFQQTFELPLINEPQANTDIRCLIGTLFNHGSFESIVGKTTRTCRRLMKVRVYRNLNKPEFYSILAMEGENKGKVVGYAKSVLIENCQLIVSTASRKRVLRDNRKNVHAFCQGILCDAADIVQKLNGSELEVTYSPYKMDTFYQRCNEKPFTDKCNQALLQGSSIFVTEMVTQA
jgi:hypothetical protein